MLEHRVGKHHVERVRLKRELVGVGRSERDVTDTSIICVLFRLPHLSLVGVYPDHTPMRYTLRDIACDGARSTANIQYRESIVEKRDSERPVRLQRPLGHEAHGVLSVSGVYCSLTASLTYFQAAATNRLASNPYSVPSKSPNSLT